MPPRPRLSLGNFWRECQGLLERRRHSNQPMYCEPAESLLQLVMNGPNTHPSNGACRQTGAVLLQEIALHVLQGRCLARRRTRCARGRQIYKGDRRNAGDGWRGTVAQCRAAHCQTRIAHAPMCFVLESSIWLADGDDGTNQPRRQGKAR